VDELLCQSSNITLDNKLLGVKFTRFDSDEKLSEKFIEFLSLHGHRVTTINCLNMQCLFNSTEFLRLMPNLITVTVDCKEYFRSLPDTGMERNSIKLNHLTVSTPFESDWKFLDVFDVVELTIVRASQNLHEKCVEFVSSRKSLKRLRLNNCKRAPELLTTLAQMNLDALHIYNCCCNELTIDESLIASLKNLPSFSFNNYDSVNCSTLTAICQHLTSLVSLELFISWSTDEEREIAATALHHIASLKTFKLKVPKLSSEMAQNVLSLAPPHLESLTLKTDQEITKNDILALAATFTSLKSLTLKLFPHRFHAILAQILVSFDRLENLSVTHTRYGKCAIDEQFYDLKHPNPNLKTLELKICCFNPVKLLQKIIDDFPNLETFPSDFLDSHLQLLGEKIENFPVFMVSLKAAENAIEKLKDCSVVFNSSGWCFDSVRATRDGRKAITIGIAEVR
jgi:hypothetical protein